MFLITAVNNFSEDIRWPYGTTTTPTHPESTIFKEIVKKIFKLSVYLAQCFQPTKEKIAQLAQISVLRGIYTTIL